MKRKILAISLFLVIVASVVALREGVNIYRALNRLSRIRVVQKGESGAISLYSNDAKGRRWELEADNAVISGDTVWLKGVRLRFVARGSRVEVSGEEGVYNRKRKEGVLKGRVVAKGEGWVVRGGKLVWNQSKGTICIPGRFVFEGRYRVTGSRLCLFPDRERVVVERLDRVVMR